MSNNGRIRRWPGRSDSAMRYVPSTYVYDHSEHPATCVLAAEEIVAEASDSTDIYGRRLSLALIKLDQRASSLRCAPVIYGRCGVDILHAQSVVPRMETIAVATDYRVVESQLTLVELSDLPRKPHGCPSEVERSWARLVASRKAVAGLFAILNDLRSAQDETRGRVPELHRDQARAAIVFTAAGMDACLRTLLSDALPTLLSEEGPAHGAFTRHFFASRLQGEMSKATKRAIVDINPRSALIDLYVEDLTGRSIQGWKDLGNCRDALGVVSSKLEDDVLQTHQDFFNARHEVVHEFDLIDPSGKGSSGRRHRDIGAVGSQCDRAFGLLHDFISLTSRAVKSVGVKRATSGDQTKSLRPG